MISFKAGDEVVLKSAWSYVNIFKIKELGENDICKYAVFTNGHNAKLEYIRHATHDDEWRRSFGDELQ